MWGVAELWVRPASGIRGYGGARAERGAARAMLFQIQTRADARARGARPAGAGCRAGPWQPRGGGRRRGSRPRGALDGSARPTHWLARARARARRSWFQNTRALVTGPAAGGTPGGCAAPALFSARPAAGPGLNTTSQGNRAAAAAAGAGPMGGSKGLETLQAPRGDAAIGAPAPGHAAARAGGRGRGPGARAGRGAGAGGATRRARRPGAHQKQCGIFPGRPAPGRRAGRGAARAPRGPGVGRRACARAALARRPAGARPRAAREEGARSRACAAAQQGGVARFTCTALGGARARCGRQRQAPQQAGSVSHAYDGMSSAAPPGAHRAPAGRGIHARARAALQRPLAPPLHAS